MMTSRWTKCISTNGALRGVAIQATELVQELADRHDLSERGRQGFGESVLAALTLASYCKPGERVNLNIQATGYFQQAIVDANPEGKVRGYLIERDEPLTKSSVHIASSSQTDEKPSAGEASNSEESSARESGPWGEGLLSVLRTRDLEGEQGKKQPYVGTVPLITGHLAKDLSFYWVQSEQVPSAVGLAVATEGKKIRQAGAFLVQAMPGASTEEVRMIEKQINELDSLSRAFGDHENPVHLLSRIFQDTSFVLVEEKELQFECTCDQKRVERALTLVGTAELKSILAEAGEAFVRCDFCGREYRVMSEKLEELIRQAKG